MTTCSWTTEACRHECVTGAGRGHRVGSSRRDRSDRRCGGDCHDGRGCVPRPPRLRNGSVADILLRRDQRHARLPGSRTCERTDDNDVPLAKKRQVNADAARAPGRARNDRRLQFPCPKLAVERFGCGIDDLEIERRDAGSGRRSEVEQDRWARSCTSRRASAVPESIP